jgi:asparagine synthase (glutamine-hydrolysing)
MCGIAGILDIQGQRDINQLVLERMNQVQVHRGPDDGGYFFQSGVGLAHRRLSIIDISAGHQPLFSHDKSVVIVFNGEIYNFQEIRKELINKGYHFNTHSDTEVIVCAWQEWKEKCVEHLRGMFAFAIWDKNKKILFLARDRLGIKPLFYTVTSDGYLLFGSELKVLLEHPSFRKEMDQSCIEDYCALGYIPEPKTIYHNVYKLPVGHFLLIKQGQTKLTPKQYWNIPFAENSSITEQQAKEELIERFKEAVNIRMIAEVPLGAFLSGGVDSSGVVSMMAQLQEEPVNTCSIGFDHKQYNESEYAQQVSDLYKTNHFTGKVDPNDFSLIDELALLYDEPYADSSAIPTYRVCELARKKVTVALSGDGGDEPMSGYRRHCWHMNEERLRSRLPLGLRQSVFGLLGRVYPKADWAPKIFRAKTTFQALARTSVEAYFNTVSIMPDELRKQLFSPQLKNELSGYQALNVFQQYADNAPGMANEDPLALVEYLDMKTYLVDDILTKVDRASMAHSLEVRVPLLDHKFIEWVSGLPSSFKLNGQQGKYIFKKALEPYLPNDVLYRKKMGFAVPLTYWFRGPLKQRVKDRLLGDQFLDTGWFNADFLKQMVEQHQSGVRDYSAPIWTLMMLESFQRQILLK